MKVTNPVRIKIANTLSAAFIKYVTFIKYIYKVRATFSKFIYSDVGPHPHAAGLRVRVSILSEDALSADGGSSTTQGNVL